MRFVAAIGVFGCGLVFGAPFGGALMMAAAAWVIVYLAQRSSAQPSTGPSPRTDGTLDDFHSLRSYVKDLALRVETLERQLGAGALRENVEPPKVEAPPPAPPQVEPVPRIEPIKAPPPAPRIEPPAPAKTEPPVPAGPSLLSRLLEGNIVAKVGAIVLFFGVGFLLKFAYDRGMFPPELRLAGVAAGAAVAFGLGWYLRHARRLYGLVLQGVASGLLYLDVYFALKTYGFIDAGLGFVLFAALGVATTLLAVRQDAKPMAVIALIGAFLAPLLAATGSGNYIALFSYYLLLNLFVLAVSWFKAWRSLNLTGWFFTFGVAVLWGSSSYRPHMFSTIEPFLLAFFAIYVVIPVLFALRQPPSLRGWVDGTLVFGTPAAVAVLQSRLVSDMPYGLAWSAAGGAALYAVLGAIAWRHRNMRLLAETYAALAVGLGTLAIFFAFGAYTTFALWSIEGTALLWVGLRQNHLLARVSGLLVQVAGAGYFLLDYADYSRSNPYFNDAVLGCAIIVIASLLSAALLRRHRAALRADEGKLAGALVAYAALWWSLGGLDVIHHGVSTQLKPAAVLLFFSATAIAAELAGSRASWAALRMLSAAQTLALAAMAALQPALGQPLAHLGWIAWPAGLASLFWVLHRHRRDGVDALFAARYVAAWLILAAVATLEMAWHFRARDYLACLGLSLAGFGAAALRYRLREHGTQAAQLSALPLLWAMLFWFAAALSWIHDALPAQDEARAALLLVAGSALAFEATYALLGWPAMQWAARLPWLAMPAALFVELGMGVERPSSGALGFAWPVAWLLAVWSLRRDETRDDHYGTTPQHAVALYLPIVLLTWELLWWVGDWGAQWRVAAAALPTALCVALTSAASGSERWPLREHWPLYRDLLLPLPVAFLTAWFLVTSFQAPGSVQPLAGYLPLLNPLDATIGVAALAFTLWASRLESTEVRAAIAKAAAGLGFIWLNATVLRTIHYWADVPYRFDALAASVLVQASLSIVWTAAALALMAFARRRMVRGPWLAGAGLLALVVAKLFIVDLSGSATVARIVSFVGVGLLLLLIGYVAPVPPGAREADAGGEAERAR